MSAPTPLSYATWRDVDHTVGRLPDAQAHSMRFLVPLFLLGVAVLGGSGLVEVNLQPPLRPGPAPAFPTADGLPDVMIAGQTYPTTFQVVFPADWPDPEGDGLQESVMVTGRGMPSDAPAGAAEVERIFCSGGGRSAAGQPLVVDIQCRVSVPSPGPFTLHVTVGGAWLATVLGSAADRPDHTSTKHYPHTVEPARHP